jgi:hypothetical protein
VLAHIAERCFSSYGSKRSITWGIAPPDELHLPYQSFAEGLIIAGSLALDCIVSDSLQSCAFHHRVRGCFYALSSGCCVEEYLLNFAHGINQEGGVGDPRYLVERDGGLILCTLQIPGKPPSTRQEPYSYFS